MNMKRAFEILVAIIFLIYGVHELYNVFVGEPKKENEKAKQSAAYISSTAEDVDGVDFCITSVKNAKMLGNEFTRITTENNFIVVNIKITNNSNEAYSANYIRFLLTEGENEYSCYDDALFVDNHMILDSINPSITKEYTLVYEVPYKSNEKDWQMKILHNYYSDKHYTYINLKEK